QGFKELLEARRLYDQDLPSCDHGRAAVQNLDSGGSPYAAWSRLHLVFACLFPAQQTAAAFVELDRLEKLAESRGYVQLLGRVHWVRGLIDAYQTNLTASFERYGLARDVFRRTRYAEGEAMILGLLAEDLAFLGERRAAWGQR